MSAILAPPATSTSFLASLESVDMKRFRSFLAYASFRVLRDETPRLTPKNKTKRRKTHDGHCPNLEPITEKSPLMAEIVEEDTSLSHIKTGGRSLELVPTEGERKAPTSPRRWNVIPPTPPMTPKATDATDATFLRAPPSPVFYATSFLYPSTTDLLGPELAPCSSRDEPERPDVTSEASKKMYLIPSCASSQTLPRFPASESRLTLPATPPSTAPEVLEVDEALGEQGTVEGVCGFADDSLLHGRPEAIAKRSALSTRVPVIPSVHPRTTIASVSLTGVPPVCVEGPSASFLASKLSTFKSHVRGAAIAPQASSNSRFDRPPPVAYRSQVQVYQMDNCSRWSESSSEVLTCTRPAPANGGTGRSSFRLPWTRARASTVASQTPVTPASKALRGRQ